MKRKTASGSEQAFVDHVRKIEERLFPTDLDESDPTRMKSHGKYSWLYRPSHHISAGLLTQDDIELLKQPGKRLLSVGAHPAFFERVLVELGIPASNILVADTDPALLQSAKPIQAVNFDMTEAWPIIGDFDRIIFPESLCIAIGDTIKKSEIPKDAIPHATDPLETELLTVIMREALTRLRPDGIIRANGPMSHPKIVAAMSENLDKEGLTHTVNYQRFLLTIHSSIAAQ